MQLPDVAATTVQRWRPRGLSSVESRALNLIAQQAHDLPLALAGHAWSVSLVPRGTPEALPDPWSIDLRWGDSDFRLVWPMASARRWLGTRFTDLRLDDLPEAFAQAVLSHACEQAFTALEAQGLGAVAVQAEGLGLPPVLQGHHAFDLVLRQGSDELRGLLLTRTGGLLQMASRLASLPSRPGSLPVDGLPSRWRAETGFTWLSLSQWRAVRPGDAILVERPLLSPDGELWLGCGNWGLRVAYRNGTLQVRERLKQGGWRMRIDDDTQDTGEVDALAHLPLRVTFDLGDVTLTVGEVAALQVGQVIELGLPLSDAVHIRINGARVGFGEMVDIDGQLGVLVRSLAGPDPSELAPEAPDADAGFPPGLDADDLMDDPVAEPLSPGLDDPLDDGEEDEGLLSDAVAQRSRGTA